MENAYLIRVGIDSTEYSGGFNAPMDLDTYEFAYIPIREERRAYSEYKRTYEEFVSPCNRFGTDLFPPHLRGQMAHVDPDFAELTYGDIDGKDVKTGKSNHRGKPLRSPYLKENDLLVFYAGLKPVQYPKLIIDAIIGIYIVKESIEASELKERGLSKSNAHTRCEFNEADIIVIGKPNISGRLDKCIPIGKYRDHAHRVDREKLEEWGNLYIHNGYIQRSARLIKFKDPIKFYRWFQQQGRNLIQCNN